METTGICPDCGDSYGSRYHEVAHLADVETASWEELAAAAAIVDKAQIDNEAPGQKG